MATKNTVMATVGNLMATVGTLMTSVSLLSRTLFQNHLISIAKGSKEISSLRTRPHPNLLRKKEYFLHIEIVNMWSRGNSPVSQWQLALGRWFTVEKINLQEKRKHRSNSYRYLPIQKPYYYIFLKIKNQCNNDFSGSSQAELGRVYVLVSLQKELNASETHPNWLSDLSHNCHGLNSHFETHDTISNPKLR